MPRGPCWLRVRGGAWLCGDMDPDWRLTSENGSYLYPDLETGYNGVFRGGVMVAARAAIIVADKVLESVLRVKVAKVWGPGREFREASEETLSTLPLLRDPYEERLTEVRVSEVPGGGEGGARQQHQPPGGQQQRGQARRGHHSASQSSLFVGDKALDVLVIR